MLARKFALFFQVFLFLALGAALPCSAADPVDAPVKIAILPFAMHTPADLHYLQSGVREMLASRLASQGKVQIIDKVATESAAKGVKEISESEAVRIGSGLKADYVLFGSLTGMGQAVSIDAKMISVSGKGDPVTFYAQTKNLDEVVPQVNNFAQNINQKVFGRQPDKSQVSSSEAEAAAVRNPEFLLAGIGGSGDKISYLNPNFVEVTAEGSLRQPGVWRSQTFQGGFVGMDVGDVDGDGKEEVVIIQRSKLFVYRKESQGLKLIASFDGTPVDHFMWVSVADPGHEGKAKIYLTNLRRKNTSTSSHDVAAPDPKGGEDLSSYVLSVSGGKIQVVAEHVPYYLNTTYLGQRGKVLIGQVKGAIDTGGFEGNVYEMQLRGSSLVPSSPVSVPKGCNVFNFVKADINNDHVDETVMLDNSHNLRVVNGAGDQIFKAREVFAATTNVFQSKVEDLRFNMVDLFAIPSPMLITDLNKDGIPEIIINRNTTTFDKFLPDSFKFYDRGEIVSLSWDNTGIDRELENQANRRTNHLYQGRRSGRKGKAAAGSQRGTFQGPDETG